MQVVEHQDDGARHRRKRRADPWDAGRPDRPAGRRERLEHRRRNAARPGPAPPPRSAAGPRDRCRARRARRSRTTARPAPPGGASNVVLPKPAGATTLTTRAPDARSRSISSAFTTVSTRSAGGASFASISSYGSSAVAIVTVGRAPAGSLRADRQRRPARAGQGIADRLALARIVVTRSSLGGPGRGGITRWGDSTELRRCALGVDAFERGFDVIAERQRRASGRPRRPAAPRSTRPREERADDLVRRGSGRERALDRVLIGGWPASTATVVLRRTRAWVLASRPDSSTSRLAREDRRDQLLVANGELAQAIRVVIHVRRPPCPVGAPTGGARCPTRRQSARGGCRHSSLVRARSVRHQSWREALHERDDQIAAGPRTPRPPGMRFSGERRRAPGAPAAGSAADRAAHPTWMRPSELGGLRFVRVARPAAGRQPEKSTRRKVRHARCRSSHIRRDSPVDRGHAQHHLRHRRARQREHLRGTRSGTSSPTSTRWAGS